MQPAYKTTHSRNTGAQKRSPQCTLMRAVLSNLYASLPWALENFRLLFTITIFSLMSFLWHKQRNHLSFEIFSLWYSLMRGDTVNCFVTQKCQVVSQSNTKPESFRQDFYGWYLVSEFVSQRVSVGRSIKYCSRRVRRSLTCLPVVSPSDGRSLLGRSVSGLKYKWSLEGISLYIKFGFRKPWMKHIERIKLWILFSVSISVR